MRLHIQGKRIMRILQKEQKHQAFSGAKHCLLLVRNVSTYQLEQWRYFLTLAN